METSCSSKNIGKENSEEQGAIDEIYYPLIKEDKKISKEYKDNEMSLKEEVRLTKTCNCILLNLLLL